jgi:uncharacterized protein
MILKLLLIVGVITIVYMMFFKKKPSIAEQKKRKTTNTTQDSKDVNELVKCESCGTYVELNEALLSNAKYYCCSECAQKGSL